MRYLLLAILVFALAVPAFAKEIIMGGHTVTYIGNSTSAANLFSGVFGDKSEQDLIHDDGSAGTIIFTGPHGLGSTFDMTGTGGGWLLEISVYTCTGGNTPDAVIDVLGWTGTQPDENDSYFGGSLIFPDSGPYSYEWVVFDVSGEHLFLPDGDMITLFCEGGSSVWYLILDGNTSAPANSGWLWYGGSSWSDDASTRGASMIRGIYNDDITSPYAADQNPTDGATGVPVDADILFDIQDDDTGVDSSTIDGNSVVVTDDTKATISGTLTVDDANANDVHVTFDPDSDFAEGSVITVTVSPSGNEIIDGLTNEMAEDSWSFMVTTTAIESASLGEIKAKFMDIESNESKASGVETGL